MNSTRPRPLVSGTTTETTESKRLWILIRRVGLVLTVIGAGIGIFTQLPRIKEVVGALNPTPTLTESEASQKLYDDIHSTKPSYNWPLTYNSVLNFAGPFAYLSSHTPMPSPDNPGDCGFTTGGLTIQTIAPRYWWNCFGQNYNGQTFTPGDFLLKVDVSLTDGAEAGINLRQNGVYDYIYSVFANGQYKFQEVTPNNGNIELVHPTSVGRSSTKFITIAALLYGGNILLFADDTFLTQVFNGDNLVGLIGFVGGGVNAPNTVTFSNLTMWKLDSQGIPVNT